MKSASFISSKKIRIVFILLFCIGFVSLESQTLINTSFETTENYTTGSISGKNKWTVSSASGSIVNDANYVKTGSQALKISSTGTALQTDFIAYASNAVALSRDVYVDFWINLKSLPSTNFGITGYDLGTNTNRSFMLEFQPTGKIKLYNGSSGWTTQPAYSINIWKRISVKIDNTGMKCQFAIDGVVINNLFTFREIKSTASVDFHSLRFIMDAGTADVAIDNLYIGSNPLSDIVFQGSSTDRTVTITQPTYGTISLSPLKTTYQLNDQVSVSIAVPEHYIFNNWTGDLTGSDNPKTLIIDKNYTIGANVIIDPLNPPAQYQINVTQPIGATITLSPQQSSYYENSTVKATLALQSGYQFNGWTGSFSGNANPLTFVVANNVTLGALVSEIPVAPVKRTVTNATQFKDALAVMNPGDSILVADGSYNLGSVTVKRGGTSLNPIIIKSINLFGAKITGATYFNPQGQSYVTYEGFKFDVSAESTIFKMEGCSYVRISRNWFTMADSPDTTQTSKWITIGEIWNNEVCNSHHNRIDHNLFDGKHDLGALLVIDGSHGTVPDISKHDRIDHNIFRDNTPRATNEKETVRVGVSELSQLNAYTVVENNLFEDCDGDPEFVSVKSCSDTIRNNTFRRCLGTLSLRHGNNTVVQGNYILGEGKTGNFNGSVIGCGGIRVYGMNHRIFNNYFEGLTGSKWDAACTITNGDVTNTSTSLSSHFLPENVVFEYNTLVNNISNIEIGFDNNASYSKYPKNCRIENNIVTSSKKPLIKYYSSTALAGVSFSNNIMYPYGSANLGLSGVNDAQIKITNPLLKKSNLRVPDPSCTYQIPDSIYKLSSNSPAIDASVSADNVIVDFENQPTVRTRDIGADEYNEQNPVTNGIWNELQVGPNAPEWFVYEISSFTEVNIPSDCNIKILSDRQSKNIKIQIQSTDNNGYYAIYNYSGQLIERRNITFSGNCGEITIASNDGKPKVCVFTINHKTYCIKLI